MCADWPKPAARWLNGRVAMLELSVLVRVLDPFPDPGEVRTLDALNPASEVAPTGEIPEETGELDQDPAAKGHKVT